MARPPPEEPARQSRPERNVDLSDPYGLKNRNQTARRFLVSLAVVLFGLGCLVRYGVLGYPYPWKELDPLKPRFSPAAFTFSDYRSTQALQEALEKMFPPGAEKKSVDWVLRDVGHAEAKLALSTPAMTEYTYHYEEQRPVALDLIAWVVTTSDRGYNWYVLVKFDAKGRVMDISCDVDSTEHSIMGQYTNISPVHRIPGME